MRTRTSMSLASTTLTTRSLESGKGCVQIVDRTRVDGALLTTSDALDFFDNSHEVSAYDAEFGRSIIARKGTQVTNTHNSATRALIKSYRVLSRAL